MVTLRNALKHEAKENIECAESRIRELRSEVSRRLELISPEFDQNLLTVCSLVFAILSLQDDLNRERHRLASLGR